MPLWPHRCARQMLEIGLDEKPREAAEECFDRFGLVGESAALGSELRLALDEITPGVVVSTEAIVQASARELSVAIERRGGLDDRESLRVATGAGQELRPQQIDIARRAPLLRAVEQLRRADEVPAYVVFHDATLAAIAALKPLDQAQLATVPGVGEKKLERYGALVLEVVRADPRSSRS